MENNKRLGIIKEIAQLWPRSVFYLRDGKRQYMDEVANLFRDKVGVYVLYRDDVPYYVGKSTNLFQRLSGYARNPNSKYFNFWNYFTAYIVSNRKYLNDVEGILIKAMPFADNSSTPRIDRIKIPSSISRYMRRTLIAQHSEFVQDSENDEI